MTRLALAAVCFSLVACTRSGSPPAGTKTAPFDADVDFLRQHTSIVMLTDSSRARVAVAPAYQGRVMTSTTGGADAPSFGWIGRAAIQSGQRQPHMNVFGGEDRFWLGPEGGQYALYFKAGDPFDLDHWQVPGAIDWGAWDIAEQSQTSVRFRKRIALTNYAATAFDLDVDRTVRLLTGDEIAAQLGLPPAGGVRVVAFESSNAVTNLGSAPWQPQSGLVSVWILGMFNPSPQTTIALPIAAGRSRRSDRWSTTRISDECRRIAWSSRIRPCSFAATASTGAKSVCRRLARFRSPGATTRPLTC